MSCDERNRLLKSNCQEKGRVFIDQNSLHILLCINSMQQIHEVDQGKDINCEGLAKQSLDLHPSCHLSNCVWHDAESMRHRYKYYNVGLQTHRSRSSLALCAIPFTSTREQREKNVSLRLTVTGCEETRESLPVVSPLPLNMHVQDPFVHDSLALNLIVMLIKLTITSHSGCNIEEGPSSFASDHGIVRVDARPCVFSDTLPNKQWVPRPHLQDAFVLPLQPCQALRTGHG